MTQLRTFGGRNAGRGSPGHTWSLGPPQYTVSVPAVLLGPDWPVPLGSRGSFFRSSPIASAPRHGAGFLASFRQARTVFSFNGSKTNAPISA